MNEPHPNYKNDVFMKVVHLLILQKKKNTKHEHFKKNYQILFV